ncbi:hypothetical protein AB0D10_38150 [Kitasatospora sp. NPDC048545]|uniref:hypothetical protein n=1 Tax=Kitasatospora sp. NPDC048545 TaxID=3157208 RepID=UPI0033F80923
MPSVLGLLEEREGAALARVEELRAELERVRAAVLEAEEAARRAAVAPHREPPTDPVPERIEPLDRRKP